MLIHIHRKRNKRRKERPVCQMRTVRNVDGCPHFDNLRLLFGVEKIVRVLGFRRHFWSAFRRGRRRSRFQTVLRWPPESVEFRDWGRARRRGGCSARSCRRRAPLANGPAGAVAAAGFDGQTWLSMSSWKCARHTAGQRGLPASNRQTTRPERRNHTRRTQQHSRRLSEALQSAGDH